MLLDAAWQLGAWDVERIERRACNVIGASAAQALACRQAFGDYREDAARASRIFDDNIDRTRLMQLAAHRGYVRRLFRPVKGGLWQGLDEPDDTLDEDGGRTPPVTSHLSPVARMGTAVPSIALALSIAFSCRPEIFCYRERRSDERL